MTIDFGVLERAIGFAPKEDSSTWNNEQNAESHSKNGSLANEYGMKECDEHGNPVEPTPGLPEIVDAALRVNG
jgi:hypothetical protein